MEYQLGYSGIVQESWNRLLADFRKFRFDPYEEEDVRCYLYHLILERLKDPAKIHAQYPYRSRQRQEMPYFIDILVGALGIAETAGVASVPVEIKWTYFRKWRKLPKSWKRDVKKLADHVTRHQPMFGLFVPQKEDNFGPIDKNQLPRKQLEILEGFRRWAKEEHGVRVLLPYRV